MEATEEVWKSSVDLRECTDALFEIGKCLREIKIASVRYRIAATLSRSRSVLRRRNLMRLAALRKKAQEACDVLVECLEKLKTEI